MVQRNIFRYVHAYKYGVYLLHVELTFTVLTYNFNLIELKQKTWQKFYIKQKKRQAIASADKQNR